MVENGSVVYPADAFDFFLRGDQVPLLCSFLKPAPRLSFTFSSFDPECCTFSMTYCHLLADLTFSLKRQGFWNTFSARKVPSLEPTTCQIHHDMSHPLSHYFIASSHNTWVTWLLDVIYESSQLSSALDIISALSSDQISMKLPESLYGGGVLSS